MHFVCEATRPTQLEQTANSLFESAKAPELNGNPLSFIINLANLCTVYLAAQNRRIGFESKLSLSLSSNTSTPEAAYKLIEEYLMAIADEIKRHMAFMYPTHANEILFCSPNDLKTLYIRLSKDSEVTHLGFSTLFAVLLAYSLTLNSLNFSK